MRFDINKLIEAFGSFEETFRVYAEDRVYSDYQCQTIGFDSSLLELRNIEDVDGIVLEMNRISRILFVYGCLLESQARVVQQVEDEFELWLSQVMSGLNAKALGLGSESAKKDYVKATYAETYEMHKTRLRDEKYKEGLLSRVVKGLESFSYKLHSILSYKEKSIRI